MPQSDPRPGEFYLHFKQKLYQVTAVAKHSETGELMVVYQALYGTFQTYVQPLERFISPVDRGKYPDVRQKYRFQLAELKVVEKPQVKPEQESSSVSARQGSQVRSEPEQAKTIGVSRQPLTEQAKKAGIFRQESPAQGKEAEISRQPSPEQGKEAEISRQSLPERKKEAGISQQVSPAQGKEETGISRQVSPAQTARRRAGLVSRSQEEKMMAFLDAETMQEKYEILLEMQNDITDRMINNMAVALDVVIEEGPLDLRYEDLKACVRTFQRYEINELRKR